MKINIDAVKVDPPAVPSNAVNSFSISKPEKTANYWARIFIWPSFICRRMFSNLMSRLEMGAFDVKLNRQGLPFKGDLVISSNILTMLRILTFFQCDLNFQSFTQVTSI